jgi:hypothetical protein
VTSRVSDFEGELLGFLRRKRRSYSSFARSMIKSVGSFVNVLRYM